MDHLCNDKILLPLEVAHAYISYVPFFPSVYLSLYMYVKYVPLFPSVYLTLYMYVNLLSILTESGASDKKARKLAKDMKLEMNRARSELNLDQPS